MGSGAELTGAGIVNAELDGAGAGGAVTATGGTLEFTDLVDLSGKANTFDIASDGTLKFDLSVGTAGGKPIDPTITFNPGGGTLDLTGEGHYEKGLFFGTVDQFQSGDKILVAETNGSDSLALSGDGKTLYVKDGSTTKDTIKLSTSYTGQTFQLTQNGSVRSTRSPYASWRAR